ncbi:hypothetical protein AgCh_026425 [Apium graveolens]
MELFLVLRLSVTLPVTLIKEAVKGKGVADESQASKLSGNQGSQNRYLDLDKLAEQGQIKGTGPIGVGVQGLGVLQIPLYCLAWHLILCPEAEEDIFGTICYHALKASSVLAKKEVLRDTLEIQLFSPGYGVFTQYVAAENVSW